MPIPQQYNNSKEFCTFNAADQTMKKCFFIILVFTISICNAQKEVLDPILGKKVTIFSNKQFSFNYPKDWKIFNAEDENIIVVSIAPKDEISKRYMIIDSINEDGTINTSTFIELEVDKDSVKPKNRKYIRKKYIREFSKNQFNISIEKKEIGSLESFMAEREKKIQNATNVEGTIERVTENHYINELFIYDDYSSNHPITNQVHTMHYYYRNGLLYTLVFSTTPDKKAEYTEASKLIFRTFKFIEN